MKKRILIILFCLLLVFVGGAGFAVYSQLEQIDYQQAGSGEIEVNPDIELAGYTNVALFGVDSRESNLESSNSDAILVISIDHDNKTVKMVSVYRDTLLDTGDGDYRKCNAAYLKGGPEQAVSMLNTNLDLDISNYISVDFNAVAEIVDLVGGVTVTLTDEEVVYMNDYCVETSQVTGGDYQPIEPEIGGTYELNGVQAVSYARIRYTAGNDFKRTERQREIIQLVTEKVKKASPATLYKIADTVLPMVKTNFSKTQILSMGMSMISYTIKDSSGFPFELTGENLGDLGSCVIPTDLSLNVQELHELLFDDMNYQVSTQVMERSEKIDLMYNENYLNKEYRKSR